MAMLGAAAAMSTASAASTPRKMAMAIKSGVLVRDARAALRTLRLNGSAVNVEDDVWTDVILSSTSCAVPAAKGDRTVGARCAGVAPRIDLAFLPRRIIKSVVILSITQGDR